MLSFALIVINLVILPNIAGLEIKISINMPNQSNAFIVIKFVIFLGTVGTEMILLCMFRNSSLMHMLIRIGINIMFILKMFRNSMCIGIEMLHKIILFLIILKIQKLENFMKT